MKKQFTIFSLCVFISLAINAQSSVKLIQFSGFLLTPSRDTMLPVSYGQIYNSSKKIATTANYDGYFSLVVSGGDTLIFRSIGYKETKYIIPQNIQGNKFTALQILSRDLIELSEVIVVPWNTLSELRQAFVELNLSNDDLIKAQQNLSLKRLEQAEKALAYDGGEMTGYSLSQQQDKNYNNLSLFSPGITNPIAWYKFMQSLKKKK